MQVRARFAAGLAVLLAGAPALAQDRIGELERRLEEQAREIERLKTQRMQDELRRSGDAPPHVERGPDKEAAASGDAPTFDWAYDNGFQVGGTIDGAKYFIRPRAFVQLDYRAFLHSGQNLAFPTKGVPEDRFVLRRGVVGFRAGFGPFEALLEADPVRSASNLLPLANFWLEWHSFDEAKVRAGHFIPPFTWADGFIAPPNHETIEHPMIVQTLTYGFRPGAMLFGDFEKGLVSYYLSANNELDSNNAVTGDPIITARLATKVGGFGLGAAGSWIRLGGPTHDSLSAATPGQFRFFAPVPVRGWSQRYEVDVILDAGPFYLTAEYGWAHQQRDRVNAGADSEPLIAQGAYVTVGWMFLGPPPGSKSPHVPFKDWDFSLDLVRKRTGRTNVGAEVLVRVEWIEVEPARGGRDFKGNDAKAVTLGVHVYLMENVRVTAEYIHVHVGDQARAERAHSREADELVFRAQLEF